MSELAMPKFKVKISGTGDTSPAFETHHTTFEIAKEVALQGAHQFAAQMREKIGAPEQSSLVSITHQSGGEDSTVFRVIVTYPSWLETLIRMYTVAPISAHAPEIQDCSEHLANY